MTPAAWTRDRAKRAAGRRSASLSVITSADLVRIVQGHDLWDMRQIAYADGRTAWIGRRAWWFFLAPPCFGDPEDRHGIAGIRLASRGVEYLLFWASAAWIDVVEDGVIGVAARTGSTERWHRRPPLITSTAADKESERLHIVVHDGLCHLFWCTPAKRSAYGIGAPTGLYGMVAKSLDGPWRPLHGSGLVASIPPAEPFQACSWRVAGELDAISFVDHVGLNGADPAPGPDLRRIQIRGAVAPRSRLAPNGETAHPAQA